MKKCITLVLCLLLCAVILAGCGCKHETWNEADCLTPKTCAECGEIEGEALGHSWADATCETPKTCTTCGVTEGEALGHSWADATCEAAKTCSVCGETEGEALGHSFGEWTEIDMENEERTCSACGYTEQQVIDRMAELMAHLEGDWHLVGLASLNNGEYYRISDLPNPEEFETTMHFSSDGSIIFSTLGTEEGYEMNDSWLEYTIDADTGTTIYTFFIVAGSNTYECSLLIPQEGAEGVPTLILVTSDYFWYLIQE